MYCLNKSMYYAVYFCEYEWNWGLYRILLFGYIGLLILLCFCILNAFPILQMNFEVRWHATMMLHSWNVIRILVLLSIVLVLDEPSTKVYSVPSLRVYVKKVSIKNLSTNTPIYTHTLFFEIIQI